MAFLLIAILCTTSLNVIFKISEGKNSNRYAVSSFNCLSAMSLAMVPDRSSIVTRLGMAIRALKMSEMFHTTASSCVAPTKATRA